MNDDEPDDVFAPQVMCPRCGRRHHHWSAVAHCRWPGATIGGDPHPGRPCWALVSRCGRNLTAVLFTCRSEAVEAQEMIGCFGCCGTCSLDHELVEMTPLPLAAGRVPQC